MKLRDPGLNVFRMPTRTIKHTLRGMVEKPVVIDMSVRRDVTPTVIDYSVYEWPTYLRRGGQKK